MLETSANNMTMPRAASWQSGGTFVRIMPLLRLPFQQLPATAPFDGEKAFTGLRDGALPWVRAEKDYVFDGPSGKVTLAQWIAEGIMLDA